MSGPDRKADDDEQAAHDEAEARAHDEAEARANANANANANRSAPHPESGQSSAMVREPSPVRLGRPGELAPHETARWDAQGVTVDREMLSRRGRFKLAIAASVALTIVFFQLLLMAPGIAIGYAVVVAPLLVYTIRVTRKAIANESSFRKSFAMTGTIFVAIFGSFIFLFMTFVTIVWIICSGTHL